MEDAEQAAAVMPTAFQNVLRTRRAERSLRGLAKAAGVAPGTLLHLESHGGDPRLTTFIALATALGVPPPDLLAELLSTSSPDMPVEASPNWRDEATWRAVAESLLRELDRRKDDDALSFLDHAVLADVTRLCVKRMSPATTVLLETAGDDALKLMLYDNDTVVEITPAVLPSSPSTADLDALQTALRSVDWGAPPGRAFVTFITWAPIASVRLAEHQLGELIAAKPGDPLGPPSVAASGDEPPAYCAVHLQRGDLRVLVASVGLDLTAPLGQVHHLVPPSHSP
ncbi:MAG TPA: helix-turn-helix transcriptional regulator [Acidimicrobiales bacterium]|nr:helix-turn-helix transcriptional regulator [Acidimicrobiales bacterium]